MKYYRELWMSGPVRKEARRIAYEELKKQFANKGKDINLASKGQIENGITVLIFNAQDVFLNKAKWNLENGYPRNR